MIMTPTTTLSLRAETGRENVAFIKDKEIWTYGRVSTEVERLAHGLIERGLRKGDRVALHMANLPELIIAYHACFRVGSENCEAVGSH
jgi:long-chain acyl-CoA synthetase